MIGMNLELEEFFDPIYEKKADIPVFKIFVNGTWKSSLNDRTFDVKTPIDGSIIAKAQASGVEDVKKAIDSADKNRGGIRDIPGIGRLEIFRRACGIMSKQKEALIKTIMLEAGKPEEDARGEVQATIDRMELTMVEARKIFGEYLPGDWSEDTTQKMAIVIRQPVGVVASISPFNYPLFIASAKIVPALLAGNSVVAKGASQDPLSLLLFARILESAGMPRGSLNLITGLGRDVGKSLVSDTRIGAINFTGSTEIGRFVTEQAGIKKLHLELGGKGMAIVLDDADLNLAAKKCVAGSLKNAGQRCDAISAIIVINTVAEELIRLMNEEIDKWKLGDPRIKSVKIGPVIDQGAAERINNYVQDAIEKGAVLCKGGKYKGCFYEPTLLDNVPLNSQIAKEETFGPIVTVIRVEGEDDAIEIARKSPYGLDSCIFTNDFYRMWKIAKKLKAGGVTINDFPKHGVGFFPFGGFNESGIGREGIGYSIDEMTYLKTIVFNLEPAGLGKSRYHYGI
jgi:glyceraldehyde-3-phosphate dehydrogenase [NAD(P)+]